MATTTEGFEISSIFFPEIKLWSAMEITILISSRERSLVKKNVMIAAMIRYC